MVAYIGGISHHFVACRILQARVMPSMSAKAVIIKVQVLENV
jgi:hypothetical protein